MLTQGGRHHELLDAGLQKIAGFLGEEEVKSRVAELMVRHARLEWPKVVGMVDMVTPVARIADGLADKLSASVLGELREVSRSPSTRCACATRSGWRASSSACAATPS